MLLVRTRDEEVLDAERWLATTERQAVIATPAIRPIAHLSDPLSLNLYVEERAAAVT